MAKYLPSSSGNRTVLCWVEGNSLPQAGLLGSFCFGCFAFFCRWSSLLFISLCFMFANLTAEKSTFKKSNKQKPSQMCGWFVCRGMQFSRCLILGAVVGFDSKQSAAKVAVKSTVSCFSFVHGRPHGRSRYVESAV